MSAFDKFFGAENPTPTSPSDPTTEPSEPTPIGRPFWHGWTWDTASPERKGNAVVIAVAVVLLLLAIGSISSPPASNTYSDAKDACGAFSAAEIAGEYGSSDTSPEGAAAAYASGYRAEDRSDAYEGCLDGVK